MSLDWTRAKASAFGKAAQTILALMIAGALGGGTCRAETLAEAIATAYDTNPSLESQRDMLKASDEGAVQARAGFRPTVNADATAQYSRAPQSSGFGGLAETEANQTQGGLAIAQTLYNGGRTTSQLDAAQAQIRADREQLRLTEASVMQTTIQAYCDVVRDRKALELYRESQGTLADAVQEIRARFEAGAATRTDVAQAEAQLYAAEALQASAEAQLDASVAEFVAAVGHHPGDLAAPGPLAGLPETLDKALQAADQESPAIRQAEFTHAVSRAKVAEARASGHSSVTLNGSIGYFGEAAPSDRIDFNSDLTVSATFHRPLFAGGSIASQVRQASDEQSSALMQIEVARRSVIQAVAQAWSQRRAAQANIGSAQAEAASAQAAYDGMRVEYRAGLRTTLDVLVAEQTVRDAQVQVAVAVHDEEVAEATLLGAIGRLEAVRLAPGVSHARPQPDVRRIGASLWDVAPQAVDSLGAFEPGP